MEWQEVYEDGTRGPIRETGVETSDISKFEVLKRELRAKYGQDII